MSEWRVKYTINNVLAGLKKIYDYSINPFNIR